MVSILGSVCVFGGIALQTVVYRLAFCLRGAHSGSSSSTTPVVLAFDPDHGPQYEAECH